MQASPAQVQQALDEASVKLLAAKRSNDRAYEQMKVYYEGAVNKYRSKGYQYTPPEGLKVDPDVQMDNPTDELVTLRNRWKIPEREAPQPVEQAIHVADYDWRNPNSSQIANGTLVRMRVGGYPITIPRVEVSFAGNQPFLKAVANQPPMGLRLARSELVDGAGIHNVRIALLLEREAGREPDPGLIGLYGHLYLFNWYHTRYTYVVGDWIWKTDMEGGGERSAASWSLIKNRDRRVAVETPVPGEEYLLYNHRWHQYLTRLPDGAFELRDEPTSDSIVVFEVPKDQTEHNGSAEYDRFEKLRRAEVDLVRKYDKGDLTVADAALELAGLIAGFSLDFFWELLGAVLMQVWKLLLSLAAAVVNAVGGTALLLLGALGVGLLVMSK